jgi:hypothetical protein
VPIADPRRLYTFIVVPIITDSDTIAADQLQSARRFVEESET